MIYEHDWIMRQIDAIVIFIAGIVRGSASSREEILRVEAEAPSKNKLYARLKALSENRKICDAENLLYKAISEKDPEALEAGMLFYFDINRFGDDELEAADFSREEVLDGIKNLGEHFGFPMEYINK